MTTGTRFELDSIECPTCGRDDFANKRGVRSHHSMSHDEKLPNLVCENCDEPFYYKTKRAKCRDCIEQEKENLRKRKPVTCVVDDCGQRFKSEKGMKIHHYYKHDESIAKYPNQNNSVGECDNEERREPCSVCGDEFINMGQHWMSTQCEYPELSERQKEMLKGILMSDGSMQFGENNNLKLTLTEYEFLEWFSDELDCICPNRYPTVHRTPEEAKENTVDYFGEEAVDMNSEYKEQYLLLTRSHPFLNEFDNWYLPEKRYPLDDLELTAPMAKMWYCGDGSLHSHHSGERAEISCANEQDRLDDVADLIREKGFDVYVMSNGTIQVTSGDTPDFLDWLGDAPPGFGYKWM